jgi:ribosomal protein S12 methylthiotransferase
MDIKKINIVTLGCSKNLVDSEKLSKQVEAAGFKVVNDSNDTSYSTVIINTCGFINDAKEESIDTILRFARLREKGLIRNIYVMGCLAERYMEELSSGIPEVRRWFGVKNTEDILAELGGSIKKELYSDRILTGPGHYAYLKVSEGCDRSCAFCAIPLIRGRCISRPVEEIVDEARLLATKGVKELILIAQDLSYYGLDLYKKRMLPRLLERLLDLKSFEWIRLHYLYPADFPREVISLMKAYPVICRYIDIPIQHISDSMLRRMKRSHDRRETEELLYHIRQELPGAAIRTTLIAGHPGETEKEYSELADFVRSFRFDRLGVFPYSNEEGTWSFNNYSDDIPQETKEARVSELMEIQQEIASELNESMTGRELKVIIDRREGEYHIGRTEYDSPDVDQEVLIPAEYDVKEGSFCQVRITRTEGFDLYGVPVSS